MDTQPHHGCSPSTPQTIRQNVRRVGLALALVLAILGGAWVIDGATGGEVNGIAQLASPFR